MYNKVLSMPPVLNSPGFWICLWFWMCQSFGYSYQGSEYVSGFEYARILNIPEFWICQGYTWFKICRNNSWICLNMSEYAWICVNMPKSAWMTFDLHFPCGYITLHLVFERLQETTGYSLKENEAVFLKRQNFIFSYFICFFISD